MPRPTPAVDALVASLSGPVRARTLNDLLRFAGRGTVDRAVATGAIVRAAPDTYASASLRSDLRTRVAVACTWAGSTATVSGSAALEYLTPTGRPVPHILVLVPPAFRRTAPPGIRLLRTKARFRRFATSDGRLALRDDAAIQVWSEAPAHSRIGTMLDLLRDGEVSVQGVDDAGRRWPRVPQRAKLLQLLDLHREGVTSYLEHVARTSVFTGPTFDGWEWQVTLHMGGRRAMVDLFHRASGTAVEFDGRRYHSSDAQRRRDIDRDTRLASQGIQTVRLTYEDITTRPGWCRQRVLEIVAARQRRSA